MPLKHDPKQSLVDSMVVFMTQNMSKIILAIVCIFFGIVISWKAERGACIINCNFTDNTKRYYFRERDVHQQDIIDIIKKE